MVETRLSAEQRRASIVEAALPLFATKGFDGTTTKELAEAAEISEALLYRHFPSKEHLYLEIENACCTEKDEICRLFSEMRPSTATLVHIVYFIVHTVAGSPAHPQNDRPVIARLLIHSYLSDGRFARLFFEKRFVKLAPIAVESMQAAIANGDMRPVSTSLTNAFWFTKHLSMSLALNSMPHEFPVVELEGSKDAILDQAVAHTLRGIGLSDEAIDTHYDPKRLAPFFESLWASNS